MEIIFPKPFADKTPPLLFNKKNLDLLNFNQRFNIEFNFVGISIYKKNYRELNKKAISEKNKIKITCDCGAEVRKSHILRHKKTQKHINLINN